MMSRTLISPYSSGAVEVFQITSPNNDVVQESQVFRSWMFPGVELLIRIAEERACDSQLVFGTLCYGHFTVEFILPLLNFPNV